MMLLSLGHGLAPIVPIDISRPTFGSARTTLACMNAIRRGPRRPYYSFCVNIV